MPATGKSAASAEPDSKTFELTITRIFDAPRDLVWRLFTEPVAGNPATETLVTLAFADLGEKTRLTFTQSGFTSEGERDGHIGGWNSAFDKLDDYVATLGESE